MKTQRLQYPGRYTNMNERSMVHQTIEQLAVPTAALGAHQAQLRQALLAASRSSESTNLKPMWRDIMTSKKFVLSGAVLAVAVAAVLAVGIFTAPSHAAYAEQLTSQSLQSFDRLSPGQQHALDVRVNGNAENELNAARHAKDLQVLSYAGFQKLTLHPQTISAHAPGGGSGPTSFDPASLTYLKYTDAGGATHVIGLGKDGLPVMLMMFRAGDGGSQGTMQVMGGTGGGPGTVEVQGSGTPTAGGGPTTCMQSSGGTTTCSGGNGSPDCQTLASGAVACSASGSTQAPQSGQAE